MSDATLGGEEILRRFIQPALKAASDAARSAQMATPGEPSSALALVSVMLLEGFTNKLIARIREQDIAERVAVYYIVAEACATALGQPASVVFPAVLRLCGEEDREFTRDVAEPAPAILSSLSSVLLGITVTYEVSVGKGADRVAQVFLHEGGEPPFRKAESRTPLRWEAVPEDVREQAIGHGRQSVSFTLYPGGNV